MAPALCPAILLANSIYGMTMCPTFRPVGRRSGGRDGHTPRWCIRYPCWLIMFRTRRNGSESKPFMLTFRCPRSDQRHRYNGFHGGTASSLRFGAGLFGVPFTTLLKACCWAVWPTPTILLLRIDRDSCGTGSGHGSVARHSFGCMVSQVPYGVEATLTASGIRSRASDGGSNSPGRPILTRIVSLRAQRFSEMDSAGFITGMI
jgi:hypothetical protein